MKADHTIKSNANAAETASNFPDMHLLHVVRQYTPMVGGLEDFVRNMAAEQRGRFASLRVVTLNRLFTEPSKILPAEETIDGVSVQRIPYFGSSRYPLAPAVFKALGNADLIHVHAVDFFFDALALMKPLHQRRLVATTHGGFFHTDQHRGLKQAWLNTTTRLTANLYDGLACCSENDFQLFHKLAPRKTRLIENGVDLSKFANAGARESQKRIVTIGRFSANKRLDRTIGALHCLLRKDPSWQLDIVGSPSDLSVDEVMQIAFQQGVSDRVQIHQGLQDEDVRKLLNECSIFVSASEYEGFGIAMIEALSAGLLPVVHPNSAYKSLAERHPMVHLADFGIPDEAADAILESYNQLRQCPDKRQEAIVSAQQHSWRTTIGHYDALYRDILARKPLSRDSAE